jgi:hypothetical protein
MNSLKLVIGPGKPSSDTLKSAKEWKVSIINAMTLEKLAQLKNKYPGAINLFELQRYLEAGQIDCKIDEYITKTEKEIALRSQIVTAVKQLGELGSEHLALEIRVQYNAVFAKESNFKLDHNEVYQLLIELSSPLTGYLGRQKGSSRESDKFYYLRDLPTP